MAEVDSPKSGHGNQATGDAGARVAFVSYASQDAAIANLVVESLERSGSSCWIAPRNVVPGSLYADEIVGAINDSKVVVLVLSQHSVASSHVGKEIERASSKRKRIIVLRTDTAPMTRAFEYFLSESQWIEVGAGGISAAASKVAESLRRYRDPSGAMESHTTSFPPPVLPTNTAPRTAWAIAGAVVVVCALAFLAFNRSSMPKRFMDEKPVAAGVTAISPAPPAAPDKSVAVLPFVDLSEKKDQEYLGDGMAEELLDLLAKLPGLRVIGRTSAFQFKGNATDLRTIGRTLGATYVVEGSVRKAGERLRVTVQLIGSNDGLHLWSETYDEQSGDSLKMQDQIASGIVRALQVTVGADDLKPREALNHPAAYDAYLRGRYASDRFDKAGLENAISYFQQAVELEPTFLRAAEWLAMSQETACEKGFVPVRECYEVARESTERVIKMNPRSGLMLSLRAVIHAIYDWDWAAASEDAKRARILDPRNSLVLVNVAQVYASLGEWDEAARLLTASVGLDPLFPAAHEWLGYMRERAGRIVEAEAEHRRVLDISPTYPYAHFSLGWTLLEQGKAEAALAEMQQETPDGNRDEGLAIVYYAMNKKAASDAALAKFTKDYPNDFVGIAEAHAYRGEKDQAFDWLDRAYEHKHNWLYMIKGNPFLRGMETDARYTKLLRKMNMPQLSEQPRA
jgi:TolB-like protein